MEPISSQRTSWHSRYAESVSRAVHSSINGINCAVSKTANVWLNTPKALKLPLETAALLYAPEEWRVGLASALVLTETPKTLAAFLRNQPIQFFGERWQLTGSSLPSDPKVPLTDLDKKIGIFERDQPLFNTPILPTSKLNDVSFRGAVRPTTPLYDMEAITNQKLEVLIEKISYFSLLKAMHLCSGLPESDSVNIFNLVDEASRSTKPSLWKIFISCYSDKISWWGRCKAGLLYLVLWNWVPIIPKTVDAYLTNMLSELRINLKENGEKRKKFINGLLEDADNFFEIYNGAAETYANDKARKGNLNHYRKLAVDLMSPTEELRHAKTLNDLRMGLYRKLSASIVDHFSPKVSFGLLEGWLNRLIMKALRDNVLPQAFLNISNEGKEAVKRHNIPFFLALTKTLTAQILKVHVKPDSGASNADSLIGMKTFESIVKKLLWSIDIAECKTVEEVRLKIEHLKQPETGIDAELRTGIQMGIQKGLAVLFDYLSKQENTEELFANLFEGVTRPLSGHLPMNDKQWAEMAVEYEGAKILLKQAGFSLSKEIVQGAIQDKVLGRSVSEVECLAQKIFSDHKARGQETLEGLLRFCTTIQNKLKQSKDCFTEGTSIHPELGAMASILKVFENEERVKITMEQDPPPHIAALPNAERAAILHALYPIYNGSNRIMDFILELQNLQKQHALSAQLAQELTHIKEALEKSESNFFPATLLTQIEQIDNHFETLKTLDPGEITQLSSMKKEIDVIRTMLKHIADLQEGLDGLANLQPFPNSPQKTGLLDDLLLYMEDRAPSHFKKWKCIEQIKKNVATAGFSREEQLQVFDFIDKIGKYNTLPKPRPDFGREIWEPLSALLNARKIDLEKRQKRATTSLKQSIPQVRQTVKSEQIHLQHSSQDAWNKMQKTASLLQRETSQFYKVIQQAKKEILLHPSAAQLGQIGGTLGFLLGLATGKISPAIGGVVGAVAASSVANLGHLAQRNWLRFSLPVLGSGITGGLAAEYIPTLLTDGFQKTGGFPTIPELLPTWKGTEKAALFVSAAATSAGLEYVGAKLMQRTIDAGMGIAMPKVSEIFDKAYEHLLTSDIVINGGLKILMKQVVDLFPPKD